MFKSTLLHYKGRRWWMWSKRQWGLMASLGQRRGCLVLGPWIGGYGVFPADGFWMIHRWFNLRFINVPTLGMAVSVNDWQCTISIGLGLFYVKFDFGRLTSVPEWVQMAQKAFGPR